ncbi:hypothetical protein D3C80_963820 [compost metagenome]
MPPDHLAPWQAEGGGRLDIAGIAHHQGLRAHQARIARHAGDAHGDDGVERALAEKGDDHQRQQQVGKGQQHIDQAHHRAVDQPWAKAGQQPQHGAEQQPQRRGTQAQHQRRAHGVYQPREDVAAVLVSAQPVQAAGRLEGLAGAGVERVGGHQPARLQRRQYQQRDEQRSQQQPRAQGQLPTAGKARLGLDQAVDGQHRRR